MQLEIPARKQEVVALDDGRVIEKWTKFDSVKEEVPNEHVDKLQIKQQEIIWYGVTDVPTSSGFQTIRFEIDATDWKDAAYKFLDSLKKAINDMQKARDEAQNKIVTATENDVPNINHENVQFGV